MAPLAGYQALVDLARRESELIASERWSDLIDLESERQEVLAALPPRAPREARSLLEEAKGIVQRNVAQIIAATEHTCEQLAHVGRGRKAVAGYAPAAPASAFVDERR